MQIQSVHAVFFSATGTTKTVVVGIAKHLAEQLQSTYHETDFTLPKVRKQALAFHPNELVVLGTPVYAGRVPNVLLPYLSAIKGNGAPGVPVVVYGNRNYDDALIELHDLMEKAGLHTIAAGAFIGEHSFSRILGKGRPDKDDMSEAYIFAGRILNKLRQLPDGANIEPIAVKGAPFPYRGYYQPRDREGRPIDIRKVKPLINDRCDDCKMCASICPMGSINPENTREYAGICIKCGACIKKCPRQARYYADEAYLYHQHELEEGLTRRAEPELFL